MKDVVMLTGAGQIGMAIARRTGYGKKIIVADNKEENARKTAAILLDAGFDATAAHVDIASRDCVLRLIEYHDCIVHRSAAHICQRCDLDRSRILHPFYLLW